MVERVLRDHSQGCEHEFFEHPAGGLLESDEVYRKDGLYYCHADGCPGGREVTPIEALEWAMSRIKANEYPDFDLAAGLEAADG